MVSPAAVLAEWQETVNEEFSLARSFLRPTPQRAETLPCPGQPRCGCRHEIVELDPADLRAVCRCELGDCPTAPVAPVEVVVHELDTARLCRAVCDVLGFDGATPGPLPGSAGSWRVGGCGAVGRAVVLSLAGDEAALLGEVGSVCAVVPEPFLLLTPAGLHFTPRVEAAVRRHRGLHLPLARMVTLTEAGQLKCAQSPGPMLAEWERRLASAPDIGGLLVELRQEIGSVRQEFQETRRIKERLEQMQGEKLFAFTDGIDPESFRILCSILAQGDVAKASRALNVSDSTVRSRMAEWETRGPAYKVLPELVRWRKSIGRKGVVPLNESITKGTAATADFAALLSDVLDELLEMDEENWEEKAEALRGLLRPYVRQ
jgi:hypothetical protein